MSAIEHILPSTPAKTRRPDWRTATILTSVFFLAALFNVWHHVLWRDELRTWQICSASSTIAQVCSIMRYDAVPVLWNALVWALTRITDDFFAMQVLHVAIASTTVLIVTAFAPFSRLAKFLFAFGYFPFFEYATISRNYALVFLLLMVATAIIARPRPQPILLAIVLAALTQVSIWGTGFAVLMLATAMLRWTWRQRRRYAIRRRTWILTIAIVLGGVIACALEVRPGPATFYITRFPQGTTTFTKLMETGATVWRGWVPVPRLARTFWNHNILDPWPTLEGIIGLVLLTTAALSMLRRPVALALLLLGALGLMTFTFTQFTGFTRHHGHLFMLLIAASWLAATTPQGRLCIAPLRPISRWLERRGPLMLIGLLVVSAVSGITVNVAGVFLPFSADAATADYLRQKFPGNNVLLVGVTDYAVSPVSAYLGRPIYYPEMGAFATFNSQVEGAHREIAPEGLMSGTAKLAALAGKDAVLIVNYRTYLPEKSLSEVDVQLEPQGPVYSYAIEALPRFSNATEGIERYALFRFRRLPTAATQARPH